MVIEAAHETRLRGGGETEKRGIENVPSVGTVNGQDEVSHLELSEARKRSRFLLTGRFWHPEKINANFCSQIGHNYPTFEPPQHSSSRNSSARMLNSLWPVQNSVCNPENAG